MAEKGLQSGKKGPVGIQEKSPNFIRTKDRHRMT